MGAVAGRWKCLARRIIAIQMEDFQVSTATKTIYYTNNKQVLHDCSRLNRGIPETMKRSH